MIKGLFCLSLLLLPLPLLSALDIYLNGELWDHYPREELTSMVIPGEDAGDGAEPVIPLRELLPLMGDWQAILIRVPGGEVLLDGDDLTGRLDSSFMKQTSSGEWQLFSEEDIYSFPRQILLTGTPDSVETITFWADPGLGSYKPLLEFWAAAHKVTLEYREMPRLRAEMIHRKMIGDPLPDFTLTGLDPADPFEQDQVISYQLRSVLLREGRNPLRIVLPRGQKAHPELFFSLMAPRLERSSADKALRETAGEYNSLLRRGVLQEAGDHRILGDQGFCTLFFPARDHREPDASLAPFPLLPGSASPPATRIIPVILEGTGPAHREEALKAYLLHQGIQYSLYRPEQRRLPALRPSGAASQEQKRLYEEFDRGFILYEENYPLWERLEGDLPGILIRNGVGATDE